MSDDKFAKTTLPEVGPVHKWNVELGADWLRVELVDALTGLRVLNDQRTFTGDPGAAARLMGVRMLDRLERAQALGVELGCRVTAV